MKLKTALLLCSTITVSACAHAPPKEKSTPLETGKAAIEKMAGCYLVDYNYAESEALKPGYSRDPRVYDVNKVKSVKEWIYTEELGDKRVRLQHILFATGPDGKLIEDSKLKHQADDWEFEAAKVYQFTGPAHWEAVAQPANSNAWTRKVTNLDDGLRYQCASPWKLEQGNPEWTCNNYSPIPGRETRDMARKDYNTLERSTRIILYGDSWLERQDNTKIVHADNGKKTPLAKEIGKNWYVRIPASECTVIKDFVDKRKEFWAILRESWDQVFQSEGSFTEKTTKPPRYEKMMELEKTYLKQDLKNPAVREQARKDILKVIADYRIDSAAPAANVSAR